MPYRIKGTRVKMSLKISRAFIYPESTKVIIFVKPYYSNNTCYIEWIINCYLLHILVLSNIYNYLVIIGCLPSIITLPAEDFKKDFKELRRLDGGGHF